MPSEFAPALGSRRLLRLPWGRRRPSVRGPQEAIQRRHEAAQLGAQQEACPASSGSSGGGRQGGGGADARASGGRLLEVRSGAGTAAAAHADEEAPEEQGDEQRAPSRAELVAGGHNRARQRREGVVLAAPHGGGADGGAADATRALLLSAAHARGLLVVRALPAAARPGRRGGLIVGSGCRARGGSRLACAPQGGRDVSTTRRESVGACRRSWSIGVPLEPKSETPTTASSVKSAVPAPWALPVTAEGEEAVSAFPGALEITGPSARNGPFFGATREGPVDAAATTEIPSFPFPVVPARGGCTSSVTGSWVPTTAMTSWPDADPSLEGQAMGPAQPSPSAILDSACVLDRASFPFWHIQRPTESGSLRWACARAGAGAAPRLPADESIGARARPRVRGGLLIRTGSQPQALSAAAPPEQPLAGAASQRRASSDAASGWPARTRGEAQRPRALLRATPPMRPAGGPADTRVERAIDGLQPPRKPGQPPQPGRLAHRPRVEYSTVQNRTVRYSSGQAGATRWATARLSGDSRTGGGAPPSVRAHCESWHGRAVMALLPATSPWPSMK
eukprot:scaffold196_cov371-Prasinococcus_capsulatus_cf.AAC.27